MSTLMTNEMSIKLIITINSTKYTTKVRGQENRLIHNDARLQISLTMPRPLRPDHSKREIFILLDDHSTMMNIHHEFRLINLQKMMLVTM